MKAEIKVPSMGESINEVTIGTILKPSGSFVKEEEELVEIETEKVNQVLYAPTTGVVTWSVDKEQTVKIGQVIGSVDTEQKGKVAAAPATAPTTQPESKPTVSLPIPSASVGAIRKTKDDFLSELKSPPTEEKKTPKPIPKEGRERREKMSKIRRVIAGRLVDALQNTAMLTTFNEVDMSKIMALREEYKEAFTKKYEVKLGFMPFFIKAAISALQAFPEINAYIEGEDVVYRNYYDISVAVGTEKGVFVPVIRNADQLSFSEIEKRLDDYAKKARSSALVADDLQGGGFTITNGGVYGSLLSTPILNMPQSAILGMHKIEKRAVVVDDTIVIRPMMYLALSYDHRIVDGKEAVSFLVHIKNCLEDPTRMLLEI